MRTFTCSGRMALTLLLSAAILPPLAAANRIYVKDETLNVGDKGVSVPVLAETDQVRHGFSLSITYDSTKLSVINVTTAGSASAGAEWSAGRIKDDQGGIGVGGISWAVILDFSDPVDINKVIPVGTDLVLVNLQVDVKAATAITTTIAPRDGLGQPAGGWTNTLSTRGVTTHPALSGGTITIQPAPPPGNRFLLGDCNGDKKDSPDVSDAVFLLTFLFLGGENPPCEAACNANGDPQADLSDAVYLLSYLFLGGPGLAAPFPACDTAPAAACAADICGLP
jgi:hypothetical protein